MRTHEGNRPDSNVQLYSSEAIIAKAARLSKLHTALLPYMRECVLENSKTGVPVMRPLFFDASDDPRAWARENYSYLLGGEMLVAPVVKPGEEEREVYLPSDGWIHLWSGKEYDAGTATVAAPMGFPPVFYRRGCAHEALFRSLAEKFN